MQQSHSCSVSDYTHSHIHAHTHAHTRVCTCMYACTCVYTRACTHAHTCSHTHTRHGIMLHSSHRWMHVTCTDKLQSMYTKTNHP